MKVKLIMLSKGSERSLKTIAKQYNISLEDVIERYKNLKILVGIKLFEITAYKWD